jgi:hypothetical protein
VLRFIFLLKMRRAGAADRQNATLFFGPPALGGLHLSQIKQIPRFAGNDHRALGVPEISPVGRRYHRIPQIKILILFHVHTSKTHRPGSSALRQKSILACKACRNGIEAEITCERV